MLLPVFIQGISLVRIHAWGECSQVHNWENDLRKKAIYLSVYLLEKKDFFFKSQFLRLKDYVVKTRWREPSVNMYSKKKKRKRKKEIS